MYNLRVPTRVGIRKRTTKHTRKEYMTMKNNAMTKTQLAEMKKALREMNLMTVEEVKAAMADHKVVTLTFYKMDGSLRVMKANRNFAFDKKNEVVTGYETPNGSGLPYNNTIKKLVTVFDLENKAFRQVPANRMLSIVVG